MGRGLFRRLRPWPREADMAWPLPGPGAPAPGDRPRDPFSLYLGLLSWTATGPARPQTGRFPFLAVDADPQANYHCRTGHCQLLQLQDPCEGPGRGCSRFCNGPSRSWPAKSRTTIYYDARATWLPHLGHPNHFPQITRRSVISLFIAERAGLLCKPSQRWAPIAEGVWRGFWGVVSKFFILCVEW